MREHWQSRTGFILAAAGSAIGLGTLWKFPYVTGDNGGGAFVLVYLFCTLFLGIPLFIGELILGRRGQRGAVGVFATLSGEQSKWRTVGWLGVIASFLILSYYCVVAGWGLNYLMMSLNQYYELHTIEQIKETFSILNTSGDISLFWAFLFLLITFGVVFQGIRKGIEYWSKFLTIALLFLLVALVIYATTLDGFGAAVRYLFLPSGIRMKASGILEALGLSFFTLSLGQGVIITYGSYLKKEEDLPKTALIVASMVIVVSVLAVLLIFPVIFTFGLAPEGGAGLIFKTLPLLFAQLPGALFLSVVFFTLFVFTALTSAVALLEVVVANLIDLKQWPRHRAVLVSTIAAFIVGIPSAFAGSGELFKTWLPIYGENFFGTVDQLVSAWIIPIGGFLLALYLGWRLEKRVVREEFLSGTTLAYLFAPWRFLIRWVAPIAMLAVFLQNGGFIDLDKWVH